MAPGQNASTTREPSSAQVCSRVAVLPADALYEILLRVPAKPLCCLRLVCRSWRSITSDPAFSRAHSSRHPLVVAFHAGELHFLDLSGNIVKRISLKGQALNPTGLHYLTTDADLICVSHRKKTCVIDPAGSITVLPPGNAAMDDHLRAVFSVIGQVPSTGEYKVLRIRWGSTLHNSQACDIITLGNGDSTGTTGRWREKPGPPNLVSMSSMRATVVKGVVYFQLLPIPKQHASNPDLLHIAAFDLSTEEWSSTPHRRGPVKADDEHTTSTTTMPFLFTRLNGSLVAVCSTCEYWDFSMGLWFAEDMVKKGLWTKRYSLHCAVMSLDGGFVTPLTVLSDGRILIWESWKRVLRACDPRTSESVDLAAVATKYRTVVMYQGNLL